MGGGDIGTCPPFGHPSHPAARVGALDGSKASEVHSIHEDAEANFRLLRLHERTVVNAPSAREGALVCSQRLYPCGRPN